MPIDENSGGLDGQEADGVPGPSSGALSSAERQAERKKIRSRQRAARRAIQGEQRLSSEASLTHHIAGLRRVMDASVVALFLADDGEPDLTGVIDALNRAGTPMALPGLKDGAMDFRPFAVGAELVTGDFGIIEPATAERLKPSELDVVLTPLVGFDALGNRIGRGAGYYDRAFGPLASRSNRPVLLGVAFEAQRVASIPCEAHDVPLDGIVTETGVRWMAPRP